MDGTMLVVGSMIGSGYIVSSDMVRQLGSAGWLMPCGFLRGRLR
jgi:APA family basic amino acid/polyamine antiporter